MYQKPDNIKRCRCIDKFQDEKYGKQMRVHNKTIKYPDSLGGWRCTKCGDVKK